MPQMPHSPQKTTCCGGVTRVQGRVEPSREQKSGEEKVALPHRGQGIENRIAPQRIGSESDSHTRRESCGGHPVVCGVRERVYFAQGEKGRGEGQEARSGLSRRLSPRDLDARGSTRQK